MAEKKPERLSIRKLMRSLGMLLRVPSELPEKPGEAEEGVEPAPEGLAEGEAIEIRIPKEIAREEKPAGAEIAEVLKPKEDSMVRHLEVLITRKIGELREKYGDIMVYGDFLASVVDAYAEEYGEEPSIWDVEEAIKHLEKERIIAGVFTLSSGARIIRLSPEGFGKDELKVLEIASTRSPPQLTIEELAVEADWPVAKARAVLEALEKAGIARHVPGSYAGEQDKWYFPGLEKHGEVKQD